MNIKDIITLSDKHKYQIVSKVIYNDTTYYYFVDIDEISNVKFLYENGNKLTEVEDKELVRVLLPMFYNEIKDLL